MRRAIGVLMLMTSVAGCASMSVTTEHSPDADFARFKTFHYRDSEMTVSDTNPTAHARTVEAIKRQLTAAGLAETEARPDLLVTYYGESTENTVVDPSGLGYAAGSTFYGAGASEVPTIRRFDRGTIVVDLWDAAASQLVWRGRVEKSLSRNPDTNLARIDEGVERMFRSFPPAS